MWDSSTVVYRFKWASLDCDILALLWLLTQLKSDSVTLLCKNIWWVLYHHQENYQTLQPTPMMQTLWVANHSELMMLVLWWECLHSHPKFTGKALILGGQADRAQVVEICFTPSTIQTQWDPSASSDLQRLGCCFSQPLQLINIWYLWVLFITAARGTLCCTSRSQRHLLPRYFLCPSPASLPWAVQKNPECS